MCRQGQHQDGQQPTKRARHNHQQQGQQPQAYSQQQVGATALSSTPAQSRPGCSTTTTRAATLLCALGRSLSGDPVDATVAWCCRSTLGGTGGPCPMVGSSGGRCCRLRQWLHTGEATGGTTRVRPLCMWSLEFWQACTAASLTHSITVTAEGAASLGLRWCMGDATKLPDASMLSAGRFRCAPCKGKA